MIFLNPLALFGLLAAAIPILLHLFNLRKLRTIEFSTLTFLKELQRTTIRRLKLRQLLLLVLRTLIVVTLVLAFSRPAMKSSRAGGIGSHPKTTAIVIVDDSYSMTLTDEQGGLLRQAKRAAADVVGLLKEGDDAVLLKLSETGHGTMDLQHLPTRDLGLLKREIEEIKPSYVYGSAEHALRYAAKLLSSATNLNKEVYLCSDFQGGIFEQNSPTTGQERLFPPEVRLFVLPVGNRTYLNLGIESVSIPTTIFEQNTPVAVRARIGNFSRNDAQDHVVSFFLNGTRVAQRGIDLQSETSTEVEFSAVPDGVGFIEGFVELEDDDFEPDNRRFLVLHIPDRVRVLLIGRSSDLRYIRLALAARLSAGGSSLELDEINAQQLSSAKMEQVDVVILTSAQELSPTQVSRLLSFVRNGGGLILFPDPSLSPRSFNNSIAVPFELPLISSIDKGSASWENKQEESFVEFEKADLRHPVFQGIFGEEKLKKPAGLRRPGQPSRAAPAAQRNVESPRVWTSARYDLTPQSNSIITLSNGSAFLAEQSVGNGRVLLYAVAPNVEWSDFPLKGLFVPLLHRSILYVHRQHAQPNEILAGNDVLLRSGARAPVPWTVQDPAGLQRTVNPTTAGWQQVFRFRNTDLVGVYSVTARNALLQKLAVGLDPRESKLARASAAEIEMSLRRIGIDRASVRTIGELNDLQRAVLDTRFGVELWKHFLIAALLLALVELLMARTGRKEVLETT